jgi:hypothetical protein
MATDPNHRLTSKRRMRTKPEVTSTASGSLILHATDDGWRLLGRGGATLFETHRRSSPPRLQITQDGGDLEVIVGQ